jgi:hypothetical protein
MQLVLLHCELHAALRVVQSRVDIAVIICQLATAMLVLPF